jgi:hypothetical protein
MPYLNFVYSHYKYKQFRNRGYWLIVEIGYFGSGTLPQLRDEAGRLYVCSLKENVNIGGKERGDAGT